MKYDDVRCCGEPVLIGDSVRDTLEAICEACRCGGEFPNLEAVREFFAGLPVIPTA